jgi:hypothetical protein
LENVIFTFDVEAIDSMARHAGNPRQHFRPINLDFLSADSLKKIYDNIDLRTAPAHPFVDYIIPLTDFEAPGSSF